MCSECLNCVPSKSINLNSKRKPQHIRRLSHKKQQLYNLVKLSQSPKHWQAYYKLKKEASNACHYSIPQLSLVENGYITKKLWSYNKSQRKDTSSIPPPSQNGLYHADPNQKAEILNDYFSSVFSDKKSIVPSVEESPIPDIAPITIYMHGVKNCQIT